MKPRRLYSRVDLDQLKKLDRTELFRVLGSFDDANMTAADFAAAVAGLLDQNRIPGLAAAMADTDATAVGRAVMAACQALHSPPKRTGAKAGQRAKFIQQANDICEHRFTFYDETHQLPASINWDFNPGTAHWGHDLNRFSFLNTLVRAHSSTGDVRYARKAVELILDWIDKCDFNKCFTGTPYVFGSYLNEAIHCGQWVRCLPQLIAAGKVEPDELLRILKSLHDQLAYLEIVTNKHSGNWPTIGFSGMLNVLAKFPVFRDNERFVNYCIGSMDEQIAAQVLPDGVQDELTPHYHRCVINNIFSVQRGLLALGRTLGPETLETLRKMVQYFQHCVTPDGKMEVGFNDSDPECVSDLAPPLASLGLSNFLLPKTELGPRLFPYAGVAFLRQKRTDGDLYLAFDGGRFGRSHQHEDKLGFVLHAYSRTFIVDPGRHLYDNSAVSFRQHLLSTAAHSTIMIDGQGQNSRRKPATWIPREPVDMVWKVTGNEIRAAAAYELGYGPDNAISVVHRREIVFVNQRFWVVFDLVEGDGEHGVESRFQYYPCALRVVDQDVCTGFDDANLLLRSLPSSPWDKTRIERGQKNPPRGWYSASYGKIEPAPALCLSLKTSLPFYSATILFPWRGDSSAIPSLETVWRDNELEVTAEGVAARVAPSLW